MTINLADHPIGTRFVTRGGRPARLLVKDVMGDQPFVAAVVYGSSVEGAHSYRANGLASATGFTPLECDIVALAPTPRKARVLVLPSALAGGRPKSFVILDGDPEFDQAFPAAILDRLIDFDVPAPALAPVERAEAA